MPVITQDIAIVRDALLAERGLHNQALPTLIERSWDRCLHNGIDARDDRLFQAPPQRAQASRIDDEYRHFIDCALPEMELLLKALSNSQWCVLCTNASGMVVKALGYSQTMPPELKVVTVQGKGLSEAEIGTTAPGCALIERRPARVERRQHFLSATSSFVCAAAPIFDPTGELAGVIDLSGVGVPAQAGMLDMVALAAQAVENQLVSSLKGEVSVRFHYRPDMLASPGVGLLRFSREGVLIGANGIARHLLPLQHGKMCCDSFESMFDAQFGALMDMARRRIGIAMLNSATGEQFSVLAETDADATPIGGRMRSRAATRSPSPAPAGPAVAPAILSPVVSDPSLAETLLRAQRVYAHDVPVLINGETGTGKEVFAKLLHETSERRHGPFVVVDCSAIPASLIEAELFGYEEGAFTSARRGGARGKIEGAHKGTLFLDEIGDMPLDLQTRLLRVLQEKSVTRVGSSRAIPADFGLVSATHRDIGLLVDEKVFREDLFFRIKGFRVALPPLRQRSDFDELIAYFLGSKVRPGICYSVSAGARRLLGAYSWPGNIRELQQVLAVARALSGQDGVILPEHLPAEITAPSEGMRRYADRNSHEKKPVDSQRAELQRLLEDSGFNISVAARKLGIARTTLYRRLRHAQLSSSKMHWAPDG